MRQLLAITFTLCLTAEAGATLAAAVASVSVSCTAMPRKPVRSGNIASIGYDESAGTLEVEFTNGSIYQYYGVPKRIYLGLMSAESHGGYLATNVKDVGYRYRKVY